MYTKIFTLGLGLLFTQCFAGGATKTEPSTTTNKYQFNNIISQLYNTRAANPEIVEKFLKETFTAQPQEEIPSEKEAVKNKTSLQSQPSTTTNSTYSKNLLNQPENTRPQVQKHLSSKNTPKFNKFIDDMKKFKEEKESKSTT